jgi:hypothetical protein
LPRTVSAYDLALMRRIDELHRDYPFAGSRMLQTFLVREVAALTMAEIHLAAANRLFKQTEPALYAA